VRQVDRFLCAINDELLRIYEIMATHAGEILILKNIANFDGDERKELIDEHLSERIFYRKDAHAIFKSLYEMNLMPEFIEAFSSHQEDCIQWLIDHNRKD
jgi:hypothetical protein